MEHPENSDAYKGLTVNKGIEQPSIVNPYLKLRKKPKRRQFSVGEYVEGIVKGDVTVLSQAVTLVESVKPEHQTAQQRKSGRRDDAASPSERVAKGEKYRRDELHARHEAERELYGDEERRCERTNRDLSCREHQYVPIASR